MCGTSIFVAHMGEVSAQAKEVFCEKSFLNLLVINLLISDFMTGLVSDYIAELNYGLKW